MLRSSSRRARRTAGSVLPLSPKRRSKTTRGSFSIGRGVVGDRHEMVLVYAQLNPASHEPAKSRPSRATSREESSVCWPSSRPSNWSMDGPRVDLRPVGLPARDTGQELGRRAGVGAAAGPRVEAGQHKGVIAVRLHRREDRRQVERLALRGRRPVLHRHPVRDVDHAEATHAGSGRAADRRQRGHHAVEQRQRQGGAETTQNRAPGNRFPGDDHDPVLRI